MNIFSLEKKSESDGRPLVAASVQYTNEHQYKSLLRQERAWVFSSRDRRLS